MDKQGWAVAELERIEAELAKIAMLQKRRDSLRQYIELDRILFDKQSADNARQDDSTDAAARKQQVALDAPNLRDERPRRESAKDRILNGAARLIDSNGPMQTVDLVKMLERGGIAIGGADKLLTVSSILSRAKDRFKSDRAAGGWVLLSPHKEETPQGAQTPAGS